MINGCFFVAVLLTGFGALMIYSSTSVVTPALAKKGATEFSYFRRHIFTIIIGVVFMAAAYMIKPSFIKKISLPLLGFVICSAGPRIYACNRCNCRRGKEMDKAVAFDFSALGTGKTCHGHIPCEVYVHA